VTIEQEVDQIKPGMTAVVDIHIDHLNDVLCVPLQAIVQRGDDVWCYVKEAAGTKKRVLELGEMNSRFAHVRAGLESGERVLLNPSAVLEAADKRHQDDVKIL
jgi:HlyD family secretion protein